MEARLRAVGLRTGFKVEKEQLSKKSSAIVLTPLTARKTLDPVVSVTFFPGKDLNSLDNNPLFIVTHRGKNLTDEKRGKILGLFRALRPTNLTVITTVEE